MSGETHFISDLHLDSQRPWVTRAFGEFLDQRRDAAALYILGDLFEQWVGDDDDSEIAGEVAHLLQHYSHAGPDLYLMHGNRDFLMGERFAVRVGATLLDDPTVVTIDEQPLLLMHGDSLCTHDREYQDFRRLVRSIEWQEKILGHPLDHRRELAAELRSASKDAGSRKAEDIMDVTGTEVARVMKGLNCEILIHGHTHRPARHEINTGVRWVLGDWDGSGWCLTLSSGEFELNEFIINQ